MRFQPIVLRELNQQFATVVAINHADAIGQANSIFEAVSAARKDQHYMALWHLKSQSSAAGDRSVRLYVLSYGVIACHRGCGQVKAGATVCSVCWHYGVFVEFADFQFHGFVAVVGSICIVAHNHHMETITRILFLALLACIGWLSYRLDAETTAHQATLDQVRIEREAAITAMRKRETETTQQLEKINAETQSKLDTVSRDAANARRAADGLRGQLADFAKRGASTDSTTACECEAKQSRIDLLAELLGELDTMAGEYAREADESRQRGLACEMSYEAVR